MNIKKLVVKNFKRFEDETFEFNPDINILVGDNESGKTTILEAIDLVLNLSYRRRSLASAISQDLFNINAVSNYLSSSKAFDDLPEILIEAYLDATSEHKGKINSLEEDSAGLFVRVFPNKDLIAPYSELIKQNPNLPTLPIEFYSIEWFDFSWARVHYVNKKIGCVFIDPQILQPALGAKRYISDILGTLEDDQRAILGLNYRQLKKDFENQDGVKKINDGLDKANEVTVKQLKIALESSNSGTLENALQLSLEDIPFSHIGKGEQHQTLIKLAMRENAKNADVLIIEEPENHLTHMNLVKLISYIEQKSNDRQVFLSTHSSYVLNKLSVDKLCLIGENGYKLLSGIDAHTAKTLKRLPGYDTLRVILADKVILVEGPSDELVIKKIYYDSHGKLPEQDGIDIIVVRGIGFRTYLEVAKNVGNRVHVVKDNDGKYDENIEYRFKDYDDFDNFKIFSPTEKIESSLEPAIIEANGETQEQLDKLAEIILSTRTFNEYNKGVLDDRKSFLRDWYDGNGNGKKKVDSAIRIFESDCSQINFPDYLTKAIQFD